MKTASRLEVVAYEATARIFGFHVAGVSVDICGTWLDQAFSNYRNNRDPPCFSIDSPAAG